MVDGELVLEATFTDSIEKAIIKLVVASEDPKLKSCLGSIAGCIADLTMLKDAVLEFESDGKITFSIISTIQDNNIH